MSITAKILVDLTSINRTIGRKGNAIKYIVWHFTGNSNDTAKGNANYFRSVNRNASAHYFVDGSEIVKVVNEENTSWHCGDGAGRYGITNYNSIGIEMCGTNGGISEETIKNALELGKELMQKYNIPIANNVRHWDASRKSCPSPWMSNDWKAWHDFLARLSGQEKCGAFIDTANNILVNGDFAIQGWAFGSDNIELHINNNFKGTYAPAKSVRNDVQKAFDLKTNLVGFDWGINPAEHMLNGMNTIRIVCGSASYSITVFYRHKLGHITCIDTPNNTLVHGDLHVQGWCLGNPTIEVYFNGSRHSEIETTMERKDVDTVYPQYNDEVSGFRFGIMYQAMREGENTFEIRCGEASSKLRFFYKTMNTGSDLIKQLQEELNKQYNIGLVVDGLVGNATISACPMLKKTTQGNITKIAQQLLVNKGYSTNGVDGIFGSGMYNAVTAFQKANGLNSDGIIGTNTWKAILN